ncbi:hypothetical protein [uncultured Pseudoteredinibacter sp.]|uniref:hypothetical protein n=1 Tax=uncultured Pseudoteredinibacter sp. TaxID=1641701 RepID=UPI00262817E5|nr:hypothetical protein [uncultured Pseudoteredinibacter sp.]
MISSQRVKRVEIEEYQGILPHLVVVALGHCCQQPDSAILRLAKLQPNADEGIYDFDFCMDPHQCECSAHNQKKNLNSYRLMHPQTASFTWVDFPKNLKAVRVNSANNSLLECLSQPEVAQAI